MPPLVVSLAVFLATSFLALAVATLLTRPRQAVRERLAAYGRGVSPPSGAARSPGRRPAESGLERKLAQADVLLRPMEFRLILLASTGAGLLLGILWRKGIPLLALLTFIGYLLPTLWLDVRRRARRLALSRQVPDALATISHALRAGYGLTQGIQAVASDLPRPISTECGRLLRELGMGLSVEEALQSLADRTQSEDLGIAVTGILINREVGGNLAELLDQIAETIRERVKLQNHIRILTVQGKISGVVAGLFPTFMALLIYALNPRYEAVLFMTPLGLTAIAVALTMQIIGGLIVWRIVNIEA